MKSGWLNRRKPRKSSIKVMLIVKLTTLLALDQLMPPAKGIRKDLKGEKEDRDVLSSKRITPH